MKQIYLILLLSVSVYSAFAQKAEKFTISGFMRDSLTTESLISATVYNKANMVGTSTNQYGFYSLTLPTGDVELIYSYVGYHTQTLNFHLRRDTMINLNLTGSIHLQEVAINASKTSPIQETTQMSVINVPVAQIKSLPTVMGETDIIKVLQMMPGIQSGNENRSGLHVRGGSPDQNLILLDGVPIYNISHPIGYFSLFNGDAINNIETYKGGFPARYGGRASSVIDISMKEGNMKKFHGEVSIGTSGKFTFEGPIVKNRTSFIITGRRSLYDIVNGRMINHANQTGQEVYISGIDTNFPVGEGKINRILNYFYDLTAKINHKFSDKDRIYLSAYIGDDKFAFTLDYKYEDKGLNVSGSDRLRSGLQWGNFMTTFRWNHIFTNRLFSNTTLSYSRYRDQFTNGKNSKRTISKNITIRDFYELQNNSGINDWIGKISFDYLPSPAHYVRFGVGAIYHTYNPGTISISDTTGNTNYGAAKRYAWEYSTYVEDDIRLTERLKTNVGLHWSEFSIGERFYSIWQPRISVRYLISQQFSAKVSYSRMAQFINLVSVSLNSISRDFWVPSTELLHPQKAEQIVFGLAQICKEGYEFSLEGYYKTITDVLDYKEGSGLLNMDEDWEQKLIQGTGRSYGTEVFIQKKKGTFTGWVGYTLSWTDRHFEELNGGRRFPYKFDRRHDLSIAFMQRYERFNNKHRLRKYDFSAAWTFGSGYCVTLPVGIVDAGHPILHGLGSTGKYYTYSDRNGYRMNPYHRLDLSFAFIHQFKGGGEQRWVISVYNAYNRKNPDIVTVEQDKNGRFKFVQYSNFTILPTISYQIKL